MGTPLLTRIQARRDRRIGPVSPLPVPIGERMSPFAKRLAERNLPVNEFRLGSFVPDGDGGAA